MVMMAHRVIRYGDDNTQLTKIWCMMTADEDMMHDDDTELTTWCKMMTPR